MHADLLVLSGEPDLDRDDGLDDFVPRPAELAELSAPARKWVVHFRPHADLYARAYDPSLVLRDLGRLGALEVSLDDRAVPTLDALAPEESYLAWAAVLSTSCEEAAIREVFEFTEGDCEFELVAEEPVAAETPGDVAPRRVTARAGALKEVRSNEVDPRAPTARTIRVDLNRFDDLANLVGELVINHALMSQRIASQGAVSSGIAAALEELDHLTRDLQDCVMSVRAQPLKFVFQRMARVMRDVEAATSKQARLIVDGEDTEVDRTLVEGLADPLTHMIRNAIDHGLETPSERVALGKPAQGTVRISARHRAGRVVIEVADDGAGINRSRVREIAVERGLVAADAQLAEDEIDQLIFMPGFSTAQAVSEVSGRGVGMDVVKCGVQSLGGRVSVHSTPGQGAVFTISLPLTLAVLDGMVISEHGQTFVVPLTAVLETISLKAGDLRRVGASLDVLMLRGTQVPAIDLAGALGLRATPSNRSPRFALVVEDDAARRAALLVDEIHGQRQVVIKSLEANFRNVEGVAAATILGEGTVALILDVNTILATRRQDHGAMRLVASR
jgi:two-component system chemotaxis sensor kinase CheA